MTAPIEHLALRYRCPFCPRSLSSKYRMIDHIGKCWRNPSARGCKTCKYFVKIEAEPEVGIPEVEDCEAGVDLSGGCSVCGVPPKPGHRHCEAHPMADMTMPGPIVGCDLWEAPDGVAPKEGA